MPTFDQARLDRLELAVRRLEDLQRKVDDKLALLDQRSRSLGASLPFMAGGGGEGGGGGGGWYGVVQSGGLTSRYDATLSPGTKSGYVWRTEWDPTYRFDPVTPDGVVEVINLGPAVSAGAPVWVEMGADGNYYAAPLECA